MSSKLASMLLFYLRASDYTKSFTVFQWWWLESLKCCIYLVCISVCTFSLTVQVSRDDLRFQILYIACLHHGQFKYRINALISHYFNHLVREIYAQILNEGTQIRKTLSVLCTSILCKISRMTCHQWTVCLVWENSGVIETLHTHWFLTSVGAQIISTTVEQNLC